MTRPALLLLLVLAAPAAAVSEDTGTAAADEFFTKLKTTVTKHLGRPYVWGATGTKSFDCSGFLWRVMFENGLLTKRTTARKFYMLLPKATPEDHTKFGTVIFFDNLKHVGIVDTGSSFYHAQVSRGTNLSPLNWYWKSRIYGYRAMPVLR